MTPKQKNILLITLAILFIVGIGITLLIVLKPHKNTTEITTMASEPCCSWDGGKTNGGDYCNQSKDICIYGCGNGARWFPDGCPTKPSNSTGCCSWDGGKTSGGDYCNQSEDICKNGCGNGAQWFPDGCPTKPTPSPPSPEPQNPCTIKNPMIWSCNNNTGSCELVKEPSKFNEFMFDNLSTCENMCAKVDPNKPAVDAFAPCAALIKDKNGQKKATLTGANSCNPQIIPQDPNPPLNVPTTCLVSPDRWWSMCTAQNTSFNNINTACGSGGGTSTKPNPWKPVTPYGPSPKHDPNNPGYNLAEFTPKQWKDDPIKASTTNFGFGGNTSCACNGHNLESELANIGYVGVATPNWLQHTYNTTTTAKATGKSTPKDMQGTDYVSNCSVGSGGCGKCFELTVTDEIDITGQQNKVQLTTGDSAKNQKIKTVVLDTCEDRNAYGNNFQWCIAANGLDKGINTNNATSEVGQDWAKNLRFGTFTTDNDSGVSTWNYPSDCIDSEGNWICTNLANAPLHFDFGIQNFLGEKQKDGTFPPDVQKALNNINPNIDWNTWNNPVVTARPIECDNEVLSTLQGQCGANASFKDGKPNQETCLYYCPPFSDPKGGKHELADWWGGCDPGKPNCSKVNEDCKETGCCQYGQVCRGDEYYMGCVNP